VHGRTAVMTIYDDQKNVVERVDLHLITSKKRLHEIMREKGFVRKGEGGSRSKIRHSKSNNTGTSVDIAESLLYAGNVPDVPSEMILLLRLAIVGMLLFITIRFYKFCKFRQSRKSS
jgi:hypothetical protein